MSLPNPIPLPAWVQTTLWVQWPVASLLYFSRKFPEPFSIRMVGKRNFVVFSAPDAVEELFTKFTSAGNEELRPFLGDNSLFLLQGMEHTKHRQLLMPLFRGERMRWHAEVMERVVAAAARRMRPGQWVDVNALMQKITIEIIIISLFGVETGGKFEFLRDKMADLVRMANGPAMFFEFLRKDLGPLSPGRKICRTLDEIEKSVLAEILERKGDEAAAKLDAISILLSGKQENRLTPMELLDEIKTILAGGHESAAASLAWALHLIQRDAGVMEKVQCEVHAANRAATTAEEVGMNTVSYLNAVCSETLRIYPAVPVVDRRLFSRARFQGREFPVGVRLAACSYLTHRRKDLFPEPEVFIPERFQEKRFSPFEFYPFGGGNRRCIGAQFAPFQIKVVLFCLLSKVRFEPYSGKKVSVVQRGLTFGPSAANTLRIAEVMT